MDIEQFTEFFKWMTIINIVLLVVSFFLITMLKGIIGRMHAKFFGIKSEDVALVCYAYLGLFKVLLIVFNIVPYVSLVLIQ